MASIPSTEFINKKVNAFRVKMQLTGRRSFAKVRGIFEGLKLGPDGMILRTGQNQIEIERAVLNLQNDFSRANNSDLDEAFNVLERSLPTISTQVKKLYEGKVEITTGDEAQISTSEALARNELTRISSSSFIQDNVLDFARQKLLSGLVTRSSPNELLADAEAGIRTRIVTALAPGVMATMDQHTRNISDLLGALNPLLSWARYAGPADQKNRSFCGARVGKDFTIDQVNAWASLTWAGKLPGTTEDNIEFNLGGYNCRHVLIFITEEEARNPGGVITTT